MRYSRFVTSHMYLNLNSGEFSMNFMNISCARVEGISVLRGLLGIRQAFRRFMWFVYEVHKKFTEYHKTKVPGRKSISLIRCQKEKWKSECLLHCTLLVFSSNCPVSKNLSNEVGMKYRILLLILVKMELFKSHFWPLGTKMHLCQW